MEQTQEIQSPTRRYTVPFLPKGDAESYDLTVKAWDALDAVDRAVTQAERYGYPDATPDLTKVIALPNL